MSGRGNTGLGGSCLSLICWYIYVDCQLALSILPLLSCDGAVSPAEDMWCCSGRVSRTWCLSSSTVVPLPSDQLSSAVITPRANGNPSLFTCTHMIINAKEIFMRTHMNISSCVCSYADARRIQSTSYAADLYACICTQACTAYRQDGTHAHAEILYSVLIIFLLCSGQTLDALLFRLQHRFLGGLQNCGESALSGSRVLYSLYSAPNKIHMF